VTQTAKTQVVANRLGELTVMADPPAKMWKALCVISARAHAAYDECSGVAAGASKDKCLFMSLAVRDFLVEIGFADACEAPPARAVMAWDSRFNSYRGLRSIFSSSSQIEYLTKQRGSHET
jgi:hypothetical protein